MPPLVEKSTRATAIAKEMVLPTGHKSPLLRIFTTPNTYNAVINNKNPMTAPSGE